jgi:hypothetical protein
MNSTKEANDFKWAIWVDDFLTVDFEAKDERFFETKDELQTFLAELEQQNEGQLDVFKYYGKTRLPWWERLLLLGEWRLHTTPCFFLAWADDCATLMFYDEASSEYRAYDHQHYIDDAPTELRIRLNFGDGTPAPLEQCLHKARAFKACHEFIDTAIRPEFLSYKYVP